MSSGLTNQETNFLQAALNDFTYETGQREDQSRALSQSILHKLRSGQLGVVQVNQVLTYLLFNSQFLGPTNLPTADIIDAGSF